LGQRELEFSGIKAQFGGGADEPFISEIGTLLPIALCGRNSSIFKRASSRLMNQWALRHSARNLPLMGKTAPLRTDWQ